MKYHVIYDGNCNLCANLVQVLEKIDQGNLFVYTPMQDEKTLKDLNITYRDCEKGMILIDISQPQNRWQGSDAAEEIGRILPNGKPFVDLYRNLPLMKNMGDRFYAYIRDNRYNLFGKRGDTYQSNYRFNCEDNNCSNNFNKDESLQNVSQKN